VVEQVQYWDQPAHLLARQLRPALIAGDGRERERVGAHLRRAPAFAAGPTSRMPSPAPAANGHAGELMLFVTAGGLSRRAAPRAPHQGCRVHKVRQRDARAGQRRPQSRVHLARPGAVQSRIVRLRPRAEQSRLGGRARRQARAVRAAGERRAPASFRVGIGLGSPRTSRASCSRRRCASVKASLVYTRPRGGRDRQYAASERFQAGSRCCCCSRTTACSCARKQPKLADARLELIHSII